MRLAFDSPLKLLRGVGEKKCAVLERIGLRTAGDLLYHFPRGYQNRGDIRRLADAADGETAAFLLTVASRPTTAMLPGRKTLTKVRAFDDSGSCSVVYFNQPYVQDVLSEGAEFRFWGKLTVRGGQRSLSPSDREAVAAGRPLPDYIALHPLTAGLTQRALTAMLREVLDGLDERTVPQRVPADIREKFGLCSPMEAFRRVHFPAGEQDMREGRRYFIFEELYLFALGMSMSRRLRQERTAEALVPCERDMAEFFDALPFAPTGAQRRAIGEIRDDLAQSVPMARMLTGDVGSGKTAVAAAAIFMAVRGGRQGALMAPTEILARQHYADLSALLGGLGMHGALLCGSLRPAEKKAVREALADGSLDYAVGTHALLSEGVSFRRLGLVVTDEQHRFGVRQRSALAEKSGGGVHTLVMSATPIPRSLALALFGGMAVSTLDELPPGRQKVDTFVVDERYRQRLDAFIEKITGAGHQVYVVCPAIETKEASDDGEDGEIVPFDTQDAPSEKTPLCSAEEVFHRLAEKFPSLRIGLVHGKLRAEEKDRVMGEFAAGEVQVLVSTTVIEVGVNVPNAVLMIVENAERFGLSQLHQLRGRVGRSSIKSYCVLVSDSTLPVSRERLNIMRTTYDGYAIAEQDLAMRGPGDFIATAAGDNRQSGALRFRLASMADTALLQDTFACAAAVLREDPGLLRAENKPALIALREKFSAQDAALN